MRRPHGPRSEVAPMTAAPGSRPIIAEAGCFDLGGIDDAALTPLLAGPDIEHVLATVAGASQVRRIVIARSRDGESALAAEYAFAAHLDGAWAEVPEGVIDLGGCTGLVFPGNGRIPLPARREPRPMSIEAFLATSVGIAAAVEAMHAAGVLHRALDPSCIMLVDGAARITSFGRAVRRGDSAPAYMPDGDALAYAAPEQARRDQPHVDERSDLYSLGVILFELLTGQLPLSARTVARWLHSQVAVEAPRPSAVRSAVPPVIDDIVTRLLEKDAGRRYQSARALRADLLRCRAHWQELGAIPPFRIGRADFSSSKLHAGHLFGRAKAIGQLVASVERVDETGRPELVLVSGPAGSGKSSLVSALPRHLERIPARFAGGKSELLQRDIPYACIRQILRSVVKQLLSGSNAALARVQGRLTMTVAGHARLLVDLVPEAEHLVGPAGPRVDLPVAMLNSLMTRAIVTLLTAFAEESSPLILFFDDLQWADPQTLAILEALIASRPRQTVLIAAFRGSETDVPAQARTVAAAARAEAVPVVALAVEPLTEADTTELLAHVLDDDPAELRSLAAVIQVKTAGNAFHIGQLLQSMVSRGVVSFDMDAQRWIWHGPAASRQGDVVELMSTRLHALNQDARELLQLLACLGGRGGRSSLAELAASSEPDLERAAQPLVAAGLVSVSGPLLSITHDRVLEAAYALTPEAQRPAEHARIARALIRDAVSAQASFEIAHQIERAALGRVGAADGTAFVRALLTAAKTARDTAAVEQAEGYLSLARRLIGNGAEADPSLLFDVEFLHCECLIALGAVDGANALAATLLASARSTVETADVFRLRAIVHTLGNDYDGAIDAALAGLAVLGIAIDRHPTDEVCAATHHALVARLQSGGLARLADMPAVTDPAIRSALALLATLISSFFVGGGLRNLHTAKIVELSLAHGVAPETAYGLAWFGVFCAQLYGEYREGFAYASAAAALANRDGFEVQRTATLVALDQVSPWTQSLGFALARARDALAAGSAAGDIGWTCYAHNHVVSDLIALGAPIPQIVEEVDGGIALTRRVRYTDIEAILQAQRHLVVALAEGPSATERPSLRPIRSVATSFWVGLYEGVAAYFFEDYAHAAVSLGRAHRLAWSAPAHVDIALCRFYGALSAARSPDVTAALAELDGHRACFAAWAALNGETFRNKLLLIDAEREHLLGNALAAQRLYEEAATAAARAGFVHEQALAHELAGRLCRDLGLGTAADAHLRTAVGLYRRWGAAAKAERIAAELEPAEIDHDAARATGRDLGQAGLNMALALSAARAFSEEIVLDRVIERLMREMIVHAGAQYGVLLVTRDGKPEVAATGRIVDGEVVVDGSRSDPPSAVPASLLNTVLRTRRAVVYADASTEGPNAEAGSDLPRRRSVMALPLIKQSNLIGILYLENNISSGVFTRERTEMLEFLAPQAAISLEAARLFREFGEENEARLQAEAALSLARSELAQTSHLTVMAGLAASIAHEISQPLTSIVTEAEAGLRWLDRPHPEIGEVVDGLNSIRESGQRAAGIVRAVRSLAKQAPVVLAPVRVDELVRDVLRLSGPSIEARGVRIVTHLGLGDRSVEADPIQLQQVILNLVTNAADAASEAGRNGQIVIHTAPEGAFANVAVHDDGPGIPSEALAKIFQPFFTTKSAGMGMGLAICRSILSAHGGTLDASSDAESGTTFTFRLPWRTKPS